MATYSKTSAGLRDCAKSHTRHEGLPDDTLPMMSVAGPFGELEMGGMFTVVKVRDDQKPGDYSDPGWYKHPERRMDMMQMMMQLMMDERRSMMGGRGAPSK